MSKHNRERRRRQDVIPVQLGKNPDIIYQVDLYGPNARMMAGRLSNMVESSCCNCGVYLLAEGNGFNAALLKAKREDRTLLTACTRCVCEVNNIQGQLERTLPQDYYHEEEFAAALSELRKAR